MPFDIVASIQNFGGTLLKLTHHASTTGCEMALNLFLPRFEERNHHEKFPILFYLSGLTCTGDNCAEKGFLQYRANQLGIAIVYPDTSPRNQGPYFKNNFCTTCPFFSYLFSTPPLTLSKRNSIYNF